ncbi:uncharacterized protein BDW70DRAFT_145733 [Aspergillus foveolatus]|uniref:uncharacterized protein n=1 Tax=Aspergillus foveolatus TaxID=210207 RepID=UPI003CCCB67C
MPKAPLVPYLTRLLDTLQQELKDNLLAVYLFGSAGYDAYEPDTSDVDVYAVIDEPISDYKQLSRKISHASIPCPARKLEFVLFTKANAALQTNSPQFEMNLNTGRDMEDDYINLDPSTDPRFWFLIDLAMGRVLGTALFGPPAGEVFAAPKLEWILDSLIESLDWHRQQLLLTSDGVLNACRALRFARTGTWGSKKDGGNWMVGYYKEHDVHVVSLALDARHSKVGVPQDQAEKFVDFVRAEIEQCRGGI